MATGVKVKVLSPDAVLPKYQTEGAAGFDFQSIEDVELGSYETKAIPTGLAFEVPLDKEIQVRPRSGLSLKTPLRVVNSPGTIDSDFRGQVCIIIQNTSDMPYKINKYDRIAQGVLCPVIRAYFEVVEELSGTDRGSGGFGHTGK